MISSSIHMPYGMKKSDVYWMKKATSNQKPATSSQCLCRNWNELSWLTCFWKVTSRLSLTRDWDSKKIERIPKASVIHGWMQKTFLHTHEIDWIGSEVRRTMTFALYVTSAHLCHQFRGAQFDRNWPSRMLTSWSGKTHVKAPGNKVRVRANFSDWFSLVWSFPRYIRE